MKKTTMTQSVCLLIYGALVSQCVMAGSLADRYFTQMSRPSPTANPLIAKASTTALPSPISEIAIEQVGPGRQFIATLKADGSLAYQGIHHVEKIGSFSGRLDPAVFKELAEQARQLGFFDLKDRYTTFMKDLPTVYISVTAGGIEKIIMDYGDAGPEKLRAFEAKVIEALSKATLTPAEGGQQ